MTPEEYANKIIENLTQGKTLRKESFEIIREALEESYRIRHGLTFYINTGDLSNLDYGEMIQLHTKDSKGYHWTPHKLVNEDMATEDE